MDFMDKLDAELKRREWSRNELATRAGLSNSYFTMMRKGTRTIGADACQKIAHALNIEIETVYGWAGLLKDEKTEGPILDEITTTAKKLSEADQEIALATIRALYEQRTRNQGNADRPVNL